MRILQINVFLAQTNDFHTMLWSNLSKIRIFGTSELKQNIFANTIMLTFTMLRILLLWGRCGAKATELTTPDLKIPETILEHDPEATL